MSGRRNRRGRPDRRRSFPGDLLGRLRGEGRPCADRDLDEEVRFHIEMEAQKYVREGLSEEEAFRRARMSFGAIERFKEECREQRRGSQTDMLMQDIRYTVRTLVKNPGFAAAAILTLALGIGANSAIFSVIYGVLLKPLPYAHGERLVLLQQSAASRDGSEIAFSIRELYDYREQTAAFDGLVEFHNMFFVLLGRGEPERVQTGVVSANFFDVLGVTPEIGRTFVEGDDHLDAEAVLVLSHGYWQRAFGGDPEVVGQVFEMNNRPHTVVGVLPPIPAFPNEVDVYMPTSACPFRANGERNMAENREAFRNLFVFGRLAHGTHADAAAAEIAGVAARFEADFPEIYRPELGFEATAVDLKEELTRDARPMLLMLLATAGVVLLIACTNVANLTLARVIRREQEIAVRAAIGASRGRLLRQLVTESLVLSLLGGLFGLAIAWVGTGMLTDFAARFTPRANGIELDAAALAFTFAIAVATGLLFGTLPAMPGQVDLGGSIREGARGTAGGRHALRKGLVVAQVALSFVLLIGAGLMLRSLMQLQAVDPGFETESVLTGRVSLNWSAFDSMQDGHEYLSLLVDRLGESPFARTAALTAKPPYRQADPFMAGFLIEGQAPEESQLMPQLDRNFISEDYFEALDIPLVRGRVFDSRDEPESAPVAVINQSMAAQFWGEDDPVGQRVSLDQGESWITVVGVVGDTRLYGPDRAVTPEFYQPFTQAGMPTWIVLRTVGDPAAAAQQVKELAYSINGSSPISDLTPMATLRSDALASPRLTASLLGLFAMLALIVTVTGIAGVMAYTVNERTREMGLRMALGAEAGGILTMLVRQGMLLVVVGLGVGVVGSVLFGRAVADMLFEVATSDPTTYLLVGGVLLLASLVGVVIPARRALKVDPVVALRAE